jgi:hypothetical protein
MGLLIRSAMTGFAMLASSNLSHIGLKANPDAALFAPCGTKMPNI